MRVAQKAFSVAGRLTPTEFRTSLTRHLTRANLPAPPANVLVEILRTFAFLAEEHGSFALRQPLDPASALSPSEFVLYNFIRNRGPVVTFEELYEANRDAGYSSANLGAQLHHSPILRRIARGLYTMIGAHFEQHDFDSAQSRLTRVGAEAELHYNSDGTVAYFVNSSPFLVYSGVMASGKLSNFRGEWITVTGQKVRIGPAFIRGLSPLVRELKLEVGDRIGVVLNTESRTLSVARITGS